MVIHYGAPRDRHTNHNLVFTLQYIDQLVTTVTPGAPFYHNVDKLSYTQQSVVWNYLTIPKLQRLRR